MRHYIGVKLTIMGHTFRLRNRMAGMRSQRDQSRQSRRGAQSQKRFYTHTQHGNSYTIFRVSVYPVFWVLCFVTFFLISERLDKIESNPRLQCYIGDSRGVPPLGVAHTMCTLFTKLRSSYKVLCRSLPDSQIVYLKQLVTIIKCVLLVTVIILKCVLHSNC